MVSLYFFDIEIGDKVCPPKTLIKKVEKELVR